MTAKPHPADVQPDATVRYENCLECGVRNAYENHRCYNCCEVL